MSSISGVGSSMNSGMLKQMQETMFKKADKNEDNSISKDEFSTLGKNKSSAETEALFAQLDSDSNGAISRLESDAAMAKAQQDMQSRGTRHQGPSLSASSPDINELFNDELDTNKDGVVSPSEQAAASNSSGASSSSSDSGSLLDTVSMALNSYKQQSSIDYTSSPNNTPGVTAVA